MNGDYLIVFLSWFGVHCLPFVYVLRIDAFVKFLKILLARLKCVKALCIGAV
jgi:hypothetical protein